LGRTVAVIISFVGLLEKHAVQRGVLGTNSAFALGPRKTTKNLDQVGRSQDLLSSVALRSNALRSNSSTFVNSARTAQKTPPLTFIIIPYVLFPAETCLSGHYHATHSAVWSQSPLHENLIVHFLVPHPFSCNLSLNSYYCFVRYGTLLCPVHLTAIVLRAEVK
jgi:hypothetical protein